MKPKTTDANKLWLDFAVPRINLYHGHAAVASLQAMAYLGVASSGQSIARDAEDLKAVKDPSEKLLNMFRFRKLLHEVQADSAKAAVDASAIIYAHAILDAVMHKLCSLSVSLDPNAWSAEIQRKQVSFSDLKSTALEQVQQKLLAAYLSQLERESLLHKCDVLFRVLKPKSVRGLLKKYRYSRDRLESLDQLRHDLVHKLRFHQKTRQVQAKVEYIFNTGTFFVNLTSKHYGVPVDVNDLKKRSQTTTK